MKSKCKILKKFVKDLKEEGYNLRNLDVLELEYYEIVESFGNYIKSDEKYELLEGIFMINHEYFTGFLEETNKLLDQVNSEMAS